jgi:serine protease Do
LRYLLTFIVFLSLLSSLLPAAHAYDRQKLLSSFFSTVLVRGYKDDGSLAYGSGVVVADNKTLTNCHVLRETKQAWVSQGEEAFGIIAVQADRWHDLCLVTTQYLPVKPVNIGSGSSLKKGQEVVAISHSNGVPAPLTSLGEIKSLYLMDGANVIRSNVRFTMGASGSGLFDEEGRLIGINTLKTSGRVAYFYALPVEWLAEVQKQPVETALPIAGKAFWEEDTASLPFFMQIAVPQLHEDWAKLAEVAARWVRAEPQSSEAWYELGLAQENTGQKAAAQKSYQQAVALDSDNVDALSRIKALAQVQTEIN